MTTITEIKDINGVKCLFEICRCYFPKNKTYKRVVFQEKKVVVTEQDYIEFTSTSYIYVSTRLAPTGSFHNKRIS